MKRSVTIIVLFFSLFGSAQVWAPLSHGLNKIPIAVSSNENIVAVAYFDQNLGPKHVYKIGIWNKNHWVQLPPVVIDSFGRINDIQLYGNALYIGGQFDSIAGVDSAKNIVMWQNRKYGRVTAVGANVNAFNQVRGFTLSQNKLNVFGSFSSTNSTGEGVIQISSSAIVPFPSSYGSGIKGSVLTAHTTSGGLNYFGGYIFKADGETTKYIARYNDDKWTTFPNNNVVPFEILSDANDLVINAYILAKSKHGFFTISDSDEVVPFEKGIDNVIRINDIHNIDGTIYASGTFEMQGMSDEQTVIKLVQGEWISIENGDLSNAHFITGLGSTLITAGRFTEHNGVTLNQIAEYKLEAGIICGNIFFSKNGDCRLDDIDPPLSKMNVVIKPDNITVIPKYDGTYHAVVSTGAKSIVIKREKFWESAECSNDVKQVNVTKGSINQEINFPMKLPFGLREQMIRVRSNQGTTIKDGNYVNYHITYANTGSTNLPSTKVELEFDNRLTYEFAKPQPDKIEAGKLTWNVNEFYFGELRENVVAFSLNADMDTEPLTVIASIQEAYNETFTDDNTSELTQILSEDEFEFKKEIVPYLGSDTAYIADSSDHIEYQISFANYTSDTVRTVFVIDTIKLNHDMLYIQEISRSHNASLDAFPGMEGEDIGILVWTFNNINLPPNPDHNPEIVNHTGFVSFEIGLKEDLNVGTWLTNTAHVTFDYFPNQPTNSVFAMISEPANVNEFSDIIDGRLYPNPAYTQVTLASDVPLKDANYSIISMEGVVVADGDLGIQQQLNVASLATGMYLIEVTKDRQLHRFKLLKL